MREIYLETKNYEDALMVFNILTSNIEEMEGQDNWQPDEDSWNDGYTLGAWNKEVMIKIGKA